MNSDDLPARIEKLRADDPLQHLVEALRAGAEPRRYQIRLADPEADIDEPGITLLPARPLPGPVVEVRGQVFASIQAAAARRYRHVLADGPGLVALLSHPGVAWVAPEALFHPSPAEVAR